MRVKWDIEIGNVLKVPLPEVVFFQEGPGLRKWQWTESGMKVINVTNILGDSAGTVDVSNTDKYISMLEFEKTYRHFAVEKGDFVVASSGNTYGKVGKITSECLPLMMNTSVIRFHSLNRDRLDDAYLYSFLRSPSFKNQIEQYVTGGAQPNFGPSHLKKMYIVLPSLPVQKKIASILSAYDGLIENNQRRIAILEEMARKEFDRMIEHARGAKTVPEVIEINPVVPKPKSVKVRYVPMSSLSTSGMAVDLQDCEMRQSSTSVRFVNGDTLLARITPCLENGKTGFVNFLDEGEIACGSSEFIVLRGKTVSPYFVYCVARMERFRGCAINSMVGASGRQRVQPACFNDFVLSIPTVKELSAFDLAVKPMFDQIGTLLKVNMKLAAARDALLPKLMSGRICSD